MLIGLDKGAADAAVLTLPTFFSCRGERLSNSGRSATMDIFYLQNAFLESTRGFLRSNRDRVIRFMKGYIEGIASFQTERSERVHQR